MIGDWGEFQPLQTPLWLVVFAAVSASSRGQELDRLSDRR